jgi:hypothetical protein
MAFTFGDLWRVTVGAGRRIAHLPAALIDEISESDPELPGTARDRKLRKKREEEFVREQQDLRERIEQESDNGDSAAMLMEVWLASEEYRRAIEELSNDVADARRAAMLAYERALKKEEEAREALEDARRKAIV